MKELLKMTVFRLLREIETLKTFKVQGNNTSHNQILGFATQDVFWRNFTIRISRHVENHGILVISTYQTTPKRPNK
jgi:hypothetical protein